MKTNEKILSLIGYGLKPSWVMSLNESQINGLHKRMKTKKETKEQDVVNIQTTVYDTKKPGVTAKLNQALKDPTKLQGKNIMVKETEITEKSVSKQQQKLMGLALSVKRGDTSKSEVSKSVKDMAKKMSEKDLEDFASTKHKGLPKKVKKTETKEGGYMDMVGKAFNKNMSNKISDIKPGLKWESILEDEFSQIIENTIFPKMTKRDFIKTIMESPEVLPKPDTKPRPDVLPNPTKPDFDPFDDPDPSDDPEARNPEVLPKPDTKPRPDVLPNPTKPDFDPFDDPDPSDDPEAGSRGLNFFMGQVKKNRMLKK